MMAPLGGGRAKRQIQTREMIQVLIRSCDRLTHQPVVWAIQIHSDKRGDHASVTSVWLASSADIIVPDKPMSAYRPSYQTLPDFVRALVWPQLGSGKSLSLDVQYSYPNAPIRCTSPHAMPRTNSRPSATCRCALPAAKDRSHDGSTPRRPSRQHRGRGGLQALPKRHASGL